MLDRLEQAFSQRQASEDRLRRFLADASHELRTPLASIRGYAELFRMGAAREPAEVEKAMRRIEDEAARMGVLVEDLLTLARLDEIAEAPHAAVDLAALAGDAVDDARATAPDREIALDAAPVTIAATTVLGDAHQLRQVLANLLRNALVHTPAGTPIEVVRRRRTTAASGSRSATTARGSRSTSRTRCSSASGGPRAAASAARPARVSASRSSRRSSTPTAARSPPPTRPAAAPCSRCSCRPANPHRQAL